MAPARSSTRRGAHLSASHHEVGQDSQNDGHNVFLDPNFGTPLQIFIEKDVEDKDILVQLIQVGFVQSVNYRNTDFIIAEAWRDYLSCIQPRKCCVHSWYEQPSHLI